jgi:predicted acylesterase/phospholipase RssA
MSDATGIKQVSPDEKCDLVMKGGITSGVAYPPVIMALKDLYRFEDIGGTSAGAIAAAAAAASEYGREVNNFQELAHIGKWLNTKRNMRNLFQPSGETSALMNLVDIQFAPSRLSGDKKAGQQQKDWIASIWSWLRRFIPLRWLWYWLTRYPRPSWGAFFGVLFGLFVAFIVSLIVFGGFALFEHTLITPATSVFWRTFIICGLLGSWLGYQFGALIDAIWKLSNTTNFFGICTGHLESGKKKAQALTDWMAGELDTMAGLEGKGPLTFGHLIHKKLRMNSGGQFERCEDGQEGLNASINLKMITTNLSQGQPYVMPQDLNGFLFKEEDMRKLFPKPVVEHMTRNPGTYSIAQKDVYGKILKTIEFMAPGGYYFLPEANDLPVVFAMRLSLSFPMLLSAIPLYTIKAEVLKGSEARVQLGEKDLQTNWFSDGGICNNFPMEFFDAWMPGHPTFGINLTSMPEEALTNGSDQGGINATYVSVLDRQRSFRASQDGSLQDMPASTPYVYLPNAQDVQDPTWQGFLHTWEFLLAIIGTGLGYRDNLQANLPSYRERIVQIRLNQEEGGLNLNMSHDTIQKVIEKGENAGQLLRSFNFRQHQWVRFRVLMNQLERNFVNLEQVMAGQLLKDLLAQQAAVYKEQPYPYCRDQQWCDEAEKFIDALNTLLTHWQSLAKSAATAQSLPPSSDEEVSSPRFFNQEVPIPDPVLRVTPEV